MTHGGRQTLTKVHCKIPYRTYERRPAPPWSRRIQQSEAVSDDEADDDDDDFDGLPPILTKAHAMLAAKRKVTLVFVCCFFSVYMDSLLLRVYLNITFLH